MKFSLTIEENIAQEFEIEANSLEEAIEMAIDEYRHGRIIVEDSFVLGTNMLIESKETDESSDWFEL